MLLKTLGILINILALILLVIAAVFFVAAFGGVVFVGVVIAAWLSS